MSAIHPFPGNKARKTPDDEQVSDRERALEAEVQALRAELAQLRRHTPLAGTDNGIHSELSDPYSTILAALNSVFPIGMFRIDANGKLQQVDPMLQQIFGLQQQEFTDFGWMRCVHPDDLETVQKHWSEDVASAKATSLEFRIIRPGSETVTHLVARNMPQFDDQGRLSGQLGFVQDVSQLRKLEAEARIKDELNRQIIASSPDCTKVLDLQGHVLQMTARGCKLVEVDDFEQVRGSDWTTWWPEDGQNLARAALDQARNAGSARFVAFGNTFKGSPRWWDTVVSPITDSNGQPVMLLAVSRDISETYEQQHQIRRLNSELETRVQERTSQLAAVNARLLQTLQDAQTLYDKAPCGYHSVDADGIFVLINQTELDWLGYTREEVIGKMTFRDQVLPADLPMIKDRLQRLIRGEKLESTELGLRRRDGSTFVALLSSTAVVDEQGRFVRTNNTLMDISARKLAEHALQAQRNFLQTVTNTVPVQLAFYDQDLICRFANASYARWLGSEPPSLIGLHLRDIARPEDFATAGARLEAAMRGEPQHFEGLRRFPDGHEFYASIEYTPYVENGQVQGLIIQMVDITERSTTRRPAATTRSTPTACTSRSTTPNCSGWATSATRSSAS
jgi:PAS domain S-box-containing protein